MVYRCYSSRLVQHDSSSWRIRYPLSPRRSPTPSKAGGISSLPRSNYRTTSVPVPIIPSSALHVHERQFNSPPPFASDIPWSKEGDEKYTEAGSFLSIGNNDPPLPSPLFTSSGAPTTFLSLPSPRSDLDPNSAPAELRRLDRSESIVFAAMDR